MVFTSKAPRKPLGRSKGLRVKLSDRAKPVSAQKALAPADHRLAQKAALQRSTLRALAKARREAEASGNPLSDWEAEFLETVSERVKTYGRAFADPDKGAMNGTLSLRQGMKLKEIRKKVQTSKPKSNDFS